MKKLKGIIICGFPGVGKSYAAQRSTDITDAESSAFHYPTDWENINEPEKMRTTEDPDWVKKYVDHLVDMASQYGYRYVLASTHDEVIAELNSRFVPYVVVAPDRSLKDEYLGRYLKRGSDADFIINLNENWDEWLDQIERYSSAVIHLKAGQTISDILPIPPR